MLIGLISDTHLPNRATEIPEKVFETFENVDLILHSGDICSFDVIDQLNKVAPTLAVRGNMDPFTEKELPSSRIIEKEGLKIGLVHGIVHPKGDLDQLYYIARELGVDILVSGHTHVPSINTIRDVLLVNPGSPTNPRLSDPSVMVMEINNKNVDINVIKVGKPVCAALNFKPPKHE